MSNHKANSSNVNQHYTGYPSESGHRCYFCHGPIRRVYATAGHTFQDFLGITREVRGQYECMNIMCPLSKHPFNPSPIEVMPYKRYSLNVWRWIAQEYKIFHQNASQIVIRIQRTFGVSFKEQQIQSIMDEIDVMISQKIDERTREHLLYQGIILLGLDGQKPDNDGNALWIFVDMISNRVLRVEILQNADADTLHTIIEEILRDYQVKMVGMVSDKQNNITNCHDTYYLDVPHQYCQFHFLQNLWNHIEVKDSSLHKAVESMVNGLNILSMSRSLNVDMKDLGLVSIRMLFAPIEADLRRILRTHTTKFSQFRGLQTYEQLETYVIHLRELVKQGNQDSRLISLLQNAIETIDQALQQLHSVYRDCRDLFLRFQAIQELLNQKNEETSHIAAVKTYFSTLWDQLRINDDCPQKKELRSYIPQKDKSHDEILREWVRLFDSYKPGLFVYFRFPVPVKTSSLLETKFSQEKGEFRRRSGRSHVGYMVRTRGEFELKRLYVEKEEIQEIVNKLGDDIDHDDVRQGLQELSNRKAEETADWGDSRGEYNGWQAMGHVLASDVKKPKRGRKKG